MAELPEIVLEKDAVFNGKRVKAGTKVQATQEAVEAAYKEAGRGSIRNRLLAVAGDQQTLLGTSIDLGHLLLVEFGKLLDAAKQSKDPVLSKYATDASNRIGEAAKASFPFQKKGEKAVLEDVVRRGTATALVLAGESAVEVIGAVSPATDTSSEKAPKKPYNSPIQEQDDARHEATVEAAKTDMATIGTVETPK